TGNAVLDQILQEVARRTDRITVRDWIETIFLARQDLEGEALRTLVARGVLRQEVSKRLWVIDVERFPVVNNRPLLHVRERLAHAIRSDAIPETRDIMLLSIAEPCGLLCFVLSEAELVRRKDRIRNLCGLEAISRSVTDAILNLDTALRSFPRL